MGLQKAYARQRDTFDLITAEPTLPTFDSAKAIYRFRDSNSPQEIKDTSAYIYDTSEALEGTIQAYTLMQELIDFEHEAYQGEVDEIGDDMLPTGSKITTTLYKNNVTDW